MNKSNPAIENGKEKRLKNLRPAQPGEVRNPAGKNQYAAMPEECRQMLLGFWKEEGIQAGVEEIRKKGRLASTYLNIFAKVLPNAPQELKADINAQLHGENFIAIGEDIMDDTPGGTD